MVAPSKQTSLIKLSQGNINFRCRDLYPLKSRNSVVRAMVCSRIYPFHLDLFNVSHNPQQHRRIKTTLRYRLKPINCANRAPSKLRMLSNIHRGRGVSQPTFPTDRLQKERGFSAAAKIHIQTPPHHDADGVFEKAHLTKWRMIRILSTNRLVFIYLWKYLPYSQFASQSDVDTCFCP